MLIETHGTQDHTLLTAAIKKQDWALFNTLINIPELVNAPGLEGFTPLMWATLQGNERMALKLLEMTSIDVNASTAQSDTALSLAIKEGLPVIAANLIRKGAHYDLDELCKTLENHIEELDSQEKNLALIDKLIDLKTIFYMFKFKMPLLDASFRSRSLYQSQRDKWVADLSEPSQLFRYLQKQLEGTFYRSATELGAKDKPEIEPIPGDLNNPDRKRYSDHSEPPPLKIIVPSSTASSAIGTPVPDSNENGDSTPDKYAERIYPHPLVKSSGLYDPRSYSYRVTVIDNAALQSSSSTTLRIPEPLSLSAGDGPPSYSSRISNPPPYRYSTFTPRISFSRSNEGMLSPPPPSYCSSLGTPIAPPSKLSGLTSSGEQPPTDPGFFSFGEPTPVSPGFFSFGGSTPVSPGFSSFGGSTPATPGFSSFGGSTPATPGFSSFGGSTPAVPGFSSFGESKPAVPGFSSFGGSTPAAPGFSSFGGSTPAAPGFSSFGESKPAVPGFSSFGGSKPAAPGFSSFGGSKPAAPEVSSFSAPEITSPNQPPSSTPEISDLERVTNEETSEASSTSLPQKASSVTNTFFCKDNTNRSKPPGFLAEIPENEQEEEQPDANRKELR